MLNQLSTKKRGGFTLVEIMIVVAIIALLAAIAVPSFLRARERSQASTVLNSLRLIDAAKDQWALENNATTGDDVLANDVALYLKEGSALAGEAEDAEAAAVVFADPRFALEYQINVVGTPVAIDTNPFDADVVPDAYFLDAGFGVADAGAEPAEPPAAD